MLLLDKSCLCNGGPTIQAFGNRGSYADQANVNEDLGGGGRSTPVYLLLRGEGRFTGVRDFHGVFLTLASMEWRKRWELRTPTLGLWLASFIERDRSWFFLKNLVAVLFAAKQIRLFRVGRCHIAGLFGERGECPVFERSIHTCYIIRACFVFIHWANPTPFLCRFIKGAKHKTHNWMRKEKERREKKKKSPPFVCTKIKHARMEVGFFSNAAFLSQRWGTALLKSWQRVINTPNETRR